MMAAVSEESRYGMGEEWMHFKCGVVAVAKGVKTVGLRKC